MPAQPTPSVRRPHGVAADAAIRRSLGDYDADHRGDRDRRVRVPAAAFRRGRRLFGGGTGEGLLGCGLAEVSGASLIRRRRPRRRRVPHPGCFALYSDEQLGNATAIVALSAHGGKCPQ